MDSTSDNEEMNCKMELGEPVVENKPPVSVNTESRMHPKPLCEKLIVEEHMKIHTDERPYECVHCKEKFQKKFHLRKHMTIHANKLKYECDECGEQFKRKLHLMTHARIHTNKKTHKCVQCGKDFNWKSHLIRHSKIHTNNRPYCCVECGERFRTKSDLNRHTTIYTNNENSLQCVEDEKKFLKKRFVTTRIKKKSHKCVECGKRFWARRYLNMHVKTHVTEKPYECFVCGKRFILYFHLVRHVMIHTKILPQKCDECGIKILQSRDLKEHVKIHLRRHKAREKSCKEFGTDLKQKITFTDYDNMPSVDHCINNPPAMTTLTNTLEIFDTYKQREDKDSDEESFHLPLDDDDSDTKSQEPVKNGNSNETEDEILDKFENTSGVIDHIDPQLEEKLLNEEEDGEKGTKDDKTSKHNETSAVNGEEENSDKKDSEENIPNHIAETDDATKETETDGTTKAETHATNEVEPDATNETSENDDVPKEDVVEKSDDAIESSAIDKDKLSKESNDLNEDLSQCVNDIIEGLSEKEENSEKDITEKSKDNAPLEEAAKTTDSEDSSKLQSDDARDSFETEKKDTDISEEQNKDSETSKDAAINGNETSAGLEAKGDNSNDSKLQNDDSEDLFDISVIRGVEEDNAAAADEARAQEIEQNENRNEEKSGEEMDDVDEMDIDKQDDQLKTDDMEIEESTLKLDGEGKESTSDGESEKTELANSNEQKDSDSVTMEESEKNYRLDEVTGTFMNGDIQVDETGLDKENEDSQKRRSLKRTNSEEGEHGVTKKSRTDVVLDNEDKGVEKPKEKLPLRTLLSFSEFMNPKKSNRRLTMHDLEEFCIQKICEVIVHKSDLGEVHHQLKMQEQLIETMRKELQQLTKQARDLEIVNKKLLNDLKQQNTTQKPLNPLKITRSVGLQVKFTPSSSFESTLKRRQANAAAPNQKTSQMTPNKNVRVNGNPVQNVNRQQCTFLLLSQATPQKPQQLAPKPPGNPLLSQALQNRKNSEVSKTPQQTPRTKPADSKSTTPSASVIDLTDEDDKKEKNKSQNKVVQQKNVAVPLRTTPVRVNAGSQGIRLATTQGTSVVTSSAPQVMYVVQSSSPNVLNSPLGSKAVVVNFQSANGVLTQALNGSAVSVIPKQNSTIQLKQVSSTKPSPPPKPVKAPNKHPAPLPPPPVVRVNTDKPCKPVPPKPYLTIRKTDTGIILQWKMPYELDMYEVIASYQLYAYQETSSPPSTDMWRKVGDVKALALPMACTLTQFADKNKYYFAVRPVDIHKRIGMFSDPEEISL